MATWCSLPWLSRMVALGVTIWNDTCSDWWANSPPFSASASARATYSTHSSMLVAVGSSRVRKGKHAQRGTRYRDWNDAVDDANVVCPARISKRMSRKSWPL